MIDALRLALLSVVLLAGCDRKVAGGRVDGAEIFREVCSRCHGSSGQPNASMIARYGVKSLRTPHVQDELKDADIRSQILRGSKNKQMPSFEGAISDAQIGAVIEHIRTFRDPASPPI